MAEDAGARGPFENDFSLGGIAAQFAELGNRGQAAAAEGPGSREFPADVIFKSGVLDLGQRRGSDPAQFGGEATFLGERQELAGAGLGLGECADGLALTFGRGGVEHFVAQDLLGRRLAKVTQHCDQRASFARLALAEYFADFGGGSLVTEQEVDRLKGFGGGA